MLAHLFARIPRACSLTLVSSEARGYFDSLRNPQRPYAGLTAGNGEEDMVRPARRRAEAGRNDRPPPPSRGGATKVPKVAKFLVG